MSATAVQEFPANKFKKKKAKKQVEKAPVHLVLDQLRRNEDLVGSTISFKFADNTTKNQVIKKQFVYNEYGRQRSTADILEDINAIAWDYSAQSFEVE